MHGEEGRTDVCKTRSTGQSGHLSLRICGGMPRALHKPLKIPFERLHMESYPAVCGGETAPCRNGYCKEDRDLPLRRKAKDVRLPVRVIVSLIEACNNSLRVVAISELALKDPFSTPHRILTAPSVHCTEDAGTL